MELTWRIKFECSGDKLKNLVEAIEGLPDDTFNSPVIARINEEIIFVETNFGNGAEIKIPDGAEKVIYKNPVHFDNLNKPSISFSYLGNKFKIHSK